MAIATDTVSGDRDRISGSVKRDRKETAHPPATVSMGNRQSGVGLTGGERRRRLPPPMSPRLTGNGFLAATQANPYHPAATLPHPSSASHPASTPVSLFSVGCRLAKTPATPDPDGRDDSRRSYHPKIPPRRDLSNREAGYWFDALISAAVILGKNILLL